MYVPLNGGMVYHGIDSDGLDPVGQFRPLQDSLPWVRLDLNRGEGNAYDVEHIGDWQEHTNGTLRAALDLGKHGPKIQLERRHPDGPPAIIDAKGRPIEAAFYGCLPSDHPRSPDEMQNAIHQIEAVERSYDIHDEHGKKLCTITYDPLTGDIYRITTEPYENLEQEAEHSSELVCVTDDAGKPTGELVTRKEAREQKRRYLVVSLLLQNGGRLCVGHRSPHKSIDPDREAISAHGVAKLLFRPDGTPIQDIRYAALVNTALELNEELRHGHRTKPFNVVVWPGNERELLMHNHRFPIDDPNTVYLVGGMLFGDHGYPLHRWQNPRTRFICSGYVFSEGRPEIAFDPSEVAGVRWLTMKEFARESNVSEDGLRCAEASYEALLESRTQWGFYHSWRFVRNSLNAVFHPDEPYIDRTD